MTLFNDHQFQKKTYCLILGILLLGASLLVWQRNLYLGYFLTQPITVSPGGHFFSQPTSLILRTPLRGTIRYTLDGSLPNASSPAYTKALIIDQPTLVHMAVFAADTPVSNIQRHDLFIGTEHQIPVLTLHLPPSSLWDPETGIYIKGNHDNNQQRGKAWERSGWLRWYGADQRLGFEQRVGVRLHGNALRRTEQKSFRLYAQDEQGREAKLTYPLFGQEGNLQHSSFVLRNGGAMGENNLYDFLRDHLASTVVQKTDSSVKTQASRPVVLYLNGEYRGLYYLRERLDDTYFEETYHLDTRSVEVVEVPLDGSEKRGQAVGSDKNSQAAAELYNQLLAEVGHCTHCTGYHHISKNVDMDNLLDYLLFEMFFANVDWPFNNTKAWRYQSDNTASSESILVPELDGRFRWLLYDLDASMGSKSGEAEAILRATTSDPYDQLIDDAFPFRNFFYQYKFQQEWKKRVEYLLSTSLSSEELVKTLDQLVAETETEMPRHLARWSGSEVTLAEWQTSYVDLLRLYLQHRPTHFRQATDTFLEEYSAYD